MTRTDIIRHRLERHITDELEAGATTPDREVWDRLADPRARFGWIAPTICAPEGADPIVVVAYHPDVLAELTDELTDEGLDIFLDVIEYMIDMHCVLITDIPDPIERQARVDAIIYDTIDPSILRFVTEIEFASLGDET